MKELYDMALSLFEALFKLIGDKREWLHYSQTFRASSSIVANIAEGIGQERNRPDIKRLNCYNCPIKILNKGEI